VNDPPASSNTAQSEYWNAAAGDTWASLQEPLDRQIAPLGEAALEALAPAVGSHVLDVGCGCGHTTVDLAVRVGSGGTVVGIDLSTPMLAVARRRTVPPGAGRIEYRQADAPVADLGPGAFDAVYSRFGVMFFGDPVAAFMNLRRALRRGGRVAFVCWRSLDVNPWMREPLEAARPLLPPVPPVDPAAPGPFAFADERRVAAILGAAGLRDIAIRAFDASIGGAGIEETLAMTLRLGPLGAALRDSPSHRAALVEPVRAVLESYLTPRGVLMPASVWIVQASS
jgi:SAM-dependent methyltransferase